MIDYYLESITIHNLIAYYFKRLIPLETAIVYNGDCFMICKFPLEEIRFIDVDKEITKNLSSDFLLNRLQKHFKEFILPGDTIALEKSGFTLSKAKLDIPLPLYPKTTI